MTVVLKKGNYEAILSLDEHGKKKTWLLTGFNTTVPKGVKMEKASDGDSGFSLRHVPTQQRTMFSHPELGADASLTGIIAHIVQNARGNAMREAVTLASDAESARRIDENGFLHVLDNPVSKVQVARYFGAEIPGWRKLELDPDAAYMMLRPADELERAAASINRLPIELMHHDTDAGNLPKQQIIGSMGSDGRFDGTYLRNSLCFTDGFAIGLRNTPTHVGNTSAPYRLSTRNTALRLEFRTPGSSEYEEAGEPAGYTFPASKPCLRCVGACGHRQQKFFIQRAAFDKSSSLTDGDSSADEVSRQTESLPFPALTICETATSPRAFLPPPRPEPSGGPGERGLRPWQTISAGREIPATRRSALPRSYARLRNMH